MKNVKQLPTNSIITAKKIHWIDLLHFAVFAEIPSRAFASGVDLIASFWSFDKNLACLNHWPVPRSNDSWPAFANSIDGGLLPPSNYLHPVRPTLGKISTLEDILPKLPKSELQLLFANPRPFITQLYNFTRVDGWLCLPLSALDLQNDNLLRLKSSLAIVEKFKSSLAENRYYAIRLDGQRTRSIEEGDVFLPNSEARKFLDDNGILNYWLEKIEVIPTVSYLWSSEFHLRILVDDFSKPLLTSDPSAEQRNFAISLINNDREFLVNFMEKRGLGNRFDLQNDETRERDLDLWRQINQLQGNPHLIPTGIPGEISLRNLIDPIITPILPASLASISHQSGEIEVKISPMRSGRVQDRNLNPNQESLASRPTTEGLPTFGIISSESIENTQKPKINETPNDLDITHKTPESNLIHQPSVEEGPTSSISPNTHEPDEVIEIREVAKILKISRTVIYQLQDKKHSKFDPTFPRRVKHGSRSIYSKRAIVKWGENLLSR